MHDINRKIQNIEETLIAVYDDKVRMNMTGNYHLSLFLCNWFGGRVNDSFNVYHAVPDNFVRQTQMFTHPNDRLVARSTLWCKSVVVAILTVHHTILFDKADILQGALTATTPEVIGMPVPAESAHKRSPGKNTKHKCFVPSLSKTLMSF